MKVTNSDCIKKSEKRFISELRRGFDLRTIRKIFKQRYNLNILKAIVTRQGDIIVFNKQVAYKLYFKAMVPLSIIFDRKGNHLALTPVGETDTGSEKSTPENNFSSNAVAEPQTGMEEITAYDLLPLEENDEPVVTDPNVDPKKNISQMANKIESMISEINRK